MQFEKFRKVSGKNQVKIVIRLSLPVKVKTDSFSLAITDVSNSDFDLVAAQDSKDLALVTIELTYRASLHRKQLSFSYS